MVLEKIKKNEPLTKFDAQKLLEVNVFSNEFYFLINAANSYSRKTFKNKGAIFAQIGIDARPCSVNCKFCQLGYNNFNSANNFSMNCEDIIYNVKQLIKDGANEIFLMSTADINKNYFLEIAKQVRSVMPEHMKLVANTGDFDLDYAKEMVNAGFTGVYHICRLNEGVDTDCSLADRIATLDAIKEANLELYYCVEPIGPEHTPEQIVEEIFRAKDYNVNVMAVMRRINFTNSPMTDSGEISAAKLALICAVATLCTRPQRAMGVHEPEIISLISGANQIYAEAGTNPRDKSQLTEEGRGFSVKEAITMLMDAQWEVPLENSAE